MSAPSFKHNPIPYYRNFRTSEQDSVAYAVSVANVAALSHDTTTTLVQNMAFSLVQKKLRLLKHDYEVEDEELESSDLTKTMHSDKVLVFFSQVRRGQCSAPYIVHKIEFDRIECNPFIAIRLAVFRYCVGWEEKNHKDFRCLSSDRV
ncbi:hypothetical protein GMOD_00002552 [Pyrenophora seminiperda CCB06]|uniref:Uncharacterized protein n=1 Tax=Pyrenophora seminiperda CCB06 TaxID=1302712 RepID=A0A3M7M2W6_9PLEO|nr:hypothetical protein GMOD_00002552 [Pyrenophora seminiperda CCB06]